MPRCQYRIVMSHHDVTRKQEKPNEIHFRKIIERHRREFISFVGFHWLIFIIIQAIQRFDLPFFLLFFLIFPNLHKQDFHISILKNNKNWFCSLFYLLDFYCSNCYFTIAQ